MKLSHRVNEARWDGAASKWKVEVEDLESPSSAKFHDECDVLIDGSGFLNTWSWPKINGFERFKMPKVHSAHWDPSLDFKGKTVGVIGNGSSAIQVSLPDSYCITMRSDQRSQIVPKLAKGKRLHLSVSLENPVAVSRCFSHDRGLTFYLEAGTLKVFMRSPTWISPALGGSVALQFQDEVGHEGADAKAENKHEQFTFTEEEKKKFRQDPEFHLKFRKRIEAEFNTLADMFIFGSSVQKQVEQMMIQQMEARIGPGHEELKAKLIPQWPPGCRRITPGDGYLETLVKENVEPVFGDIGRLTENAVEMVDGNQHKVDILVSCLGVLPCV